MALQETGDKRRHECPRHEDLAAAVLFALFFEVFTLGDLLILNLAAVGKLTPGSLQAALADAIGTDGETREQLFDVLALA